MDNFIDKIRDLLEVSKVKVKKSFLSDIYTWFAKSIATQKVKEDVNSKTRSENDFQAKLIIPVQNEYSVKEPDEIEPITLEEIKFAEPEYRNLDSREYFDGIEKHVIYSNPEKHSSNLYETQINSQAPKQYQTGTSFESINSNLDQTTQTLYEKPPETVNFENPKEEKQEEDRLGL